MSGRKRDAFWRIFKKLHNPPNWVACITVMTALVVCPLLILSVFLGYGHTMYAIIACLFCLAMLAYTVGITVNSIVKFRRHMIKAAGRYAFTRKLVNYEFRTLFFGIFTFVCNVGYTLFLLYSAFHYHSAWYATIGMYYIVLIVARGGVLLQNQKDERRYREDMQSLLSAKVGTYRYCGIMMLALALSFVVPVVELVLGQSGFRHEGWLIYVFGGVAVYKVVLAIVHFIHASKREDLAVRSVRYMNFAGTMISLLGLQTSILAAYPPKGITAAVCNGVAGGLLCLITVGLGVYMLVFAAREEKRLRLCAMKKSEEIGYNRDGYLEEYGDEGSDIL